MTFGVCHISLALPGVSVKHRFLLAEDKKPILGSDFFRAAAGLCGLRCKLPPTDELFIEFPSLKMSAPAYDSSLPVKHGLTHTISTSGPPVCVGARCLFGDKLEVA